MRRRTMLRTLLFGKAQSESATAHGCAPNSATSALVVSATEHQYGPPRTGCYLHPRREECQCKSSWLTLERWNA